MDKKIIKNQLNARFLTEESTPGIDVTKKANKESGKINKAAVKDMDKNAADYEKAIVKTDKSTKMPTNKFNYNNDAEKVYHDEMEIRNGQEMIQYDRDPNQEFKDRAEEAIAGSSRMGNNPEWANVVAKGQGGDPEFGKNLVKTIKAATKKRQDAEYKIISFGDDIETMPKGTKPMAKHGALSEGELGAASRNIGGNNPYGSEEEHAFNAEQGQEGGKYELQPIKNHGNDYAPYTHFAIHKASNSIVMPFDYSDMMPKKPVPSANTSPRAKENYKNKLAQYNQEMKEAQSELTQFKKDYFFDEIRDEVDYLLDAPFKASDYAIVTKDGLAKRGIDLNNFMLFKGDTESQPQADKQEETPSITENKNNNKPQIKQGMKRLNFKKEFNGVGNALKMIPESYKVDNKVFEMTDGNESYKIRWEGTLCEGIAQVLTASNKTMVNEDMQKMKHLMGYKSEKTLGLVKGNARLDENAIFTDIYAKTKALLEGEDIDGQTAPEGELEDIKKKSKEATKHVEGTTSTDKGTQAPKPKTGNFEEVKKSAPEATKHVEGSASTDKGTKAPKPKTGAWDDIKTSAPEATKHVKEGVENEGMGLGDQSEGEGEWDQIDVPQAAAHGNPSSTTYAPAPKTGEWDKAKPAHAADAKKHISMSEGVTLGGVLFEPIVLKKKLN